MTWIPLAVIVAFVIAYVWWGSGAILRNRMSSQQSIALYNANLEQSKESNRLRSEENELLRELIAELRASRQAPGPPPKPPADSN
jgi:hypothetical protein